MHLQGRILADIITQVAMTITVMLLASISGLLPRWTVTWIEWRTRVDQQQLQRLRNTVRPS